jgi:hypothetical protein
VDVPTARVTIDDLLALADRSEWRQLGEIFSTGAPLTPLEGWTRARYLMSYAGTVPLAPRWIDRLVGKALRRWWQGHRFYDGGREGISNTEVSFRWFWRIAFFWYPIARGDRGDEVWDFHVRTVPGTTDARQQVTGLDWYAASEKFSPRLRRPAQRFFHWFAWELTRSELVELAPGGPVLARITWRIPGGRRWWVTSYYCHEWLR